MAAMTSTSALRTRRPPEDSDFARVVEHAVLRAWLGGAEVPSRLSNEIDDPAARLEQLMARITAPGRGAQDCGYTLLRRPGLRDRVDQDHPVFARIAATVRHHEPGADLLRIRALQAPASRADLLRAVVYRMAPMFGDGAPLDRIYVDHLQRDYRHPHYTGARRDADYCAGELMEQTLGVTLLDWFELLDQLRDGWPELFHAAWRRDASACERLVSAEPHRVPRLATLRTRSDPSDKLLTICALFWEAERLFELLHLLGGRSAVTRSQMSAALRSSTSLSLAIRLGAPTGRFASSSWCQFDGLAALFAGTAGIPDPAHPHGALGRRGRCNAWHDGHGWSNDHGLELARHVAAPPRFSIERYTVKAISDAYAMTFAGRDVRTLAILFLLEVREELGNSRGPRDGAPRLFTLDSDAAIGRLATIFTGAISPAVAKAALQTSLAGMAKIDAHGVRRADATLASLIANPRRWAERNHIPPVATMSRALGDILAGPVRTCRKDEARMRLGNDIAGGSARFMLKGWFDQSIERRHLKRTRIAVPKEYRRFLPRLYAPVDKATMDFSLDVATLLIPGATDMWLDPELQTIRRLQSPPGKGEVRILWDNLAKLLT
jgi:hypothetical protein